MQGAGGGAAYAGGCAYEPDGFALPVLQLWVERHSVFSRLVIVSVSVMLLGLSFCERQGDLTQLDAKFAHGGFVEHDFVGHQVHPVVKLHFVDLVVHR